MTTIPESHLVLMKGPTLALLTTTSESGKSHESYVVCDSSSGEFLLGGEINEEQRDDLADDSEATVLVSDPDDRQRYVEIRGEFSLLSVADPVDDIRCDTPRFFCHVCPEDMRPHVHHPVAKITPTQVVTDHVLDN